MGISISGHRLVSLLGLFFSPLMGSVYTVEIISVSFTFFAMGGGGGGGQNTGDLRTIPLPFC